MINLWGSRVTKALGNENSCSRMVFVQLLHTRGMALNGQSLGVARRGYGSVLTSALAFALFGGG